MCACTVLPTVIIKILFAGTLFSFLFCNKNRGDKKRLGVLGQGKTNAQATQKSARAILVPKNFKVPTYRNRTSGPRERRAQHTHRGLPLCPFGQAAFNEFGWNGDVRLDRPLPKTSARPRRPASRPSVYARWLTRPFFSAHPPFATRGSTSNKRRALAQRLGQSVFFRSQQPRKDSEPVGPQKR